MMSYLLSSHYDYFNQWDPSTAKPIENVCGLQGDYVEK